MSRHRARHGQKETRARLRRYLRVMDSVGAGDLNLPNQCIRDGGQPKERYLTREDAKRAMKAHPRDGRVHVYRCPTCGWFHVGGKPA